MLLCKAGASACCGARQRSDPFRFLVPEHGFRRHAGLFFTHVKYSHGWQLADLVATQRSHLVDADIAMHCSFQKTSLAVARALCIDANCSAMGDATCLTPVVKTFR